MIVNSSNNGIYFWYDTSINGNTGMDTSIRPNTSMDTNTGMPIITSISMIQLV